MLTHFYESIKGWFDFPNLYAEIVREAPRYARIIEVGAWLGRSTAYLAVEAINSGKDLELHVVDTWRGSPGEVTGREADLLSVLAAFERNMRRGGVLDFLKRHQMPSVDAARLFLRESVYCAFIDGAHDYEAVRDDIAAWRPKIQPGGILAGHDFTRHHPGVVRAVLEAFDGCTLALSEHCWAWREEAAP